MSGAVRLVKPEPGIYQHLAKAHGLVPQQCLFIDDMRANIDAALNCGFQAIHFTDAWRCAASSRRTASRSTSPTT